MVGESQKASVQDLSLPAAEERVPIYKARSCQIRGGAERGGVCSQLLPSRSARGAATPDLPCVRIALHPGAAKISRAGLNASRVIMTPVQLQVESTGRLPLLRFLPRFLEAVFL